MLAGKHVRVKTVRTKLVPQYIDPVQPELLETAGSLIDLYRSLTGKTREEVETEVTELVGDNPSQIVQQGLSKLLEDRCEFEVESGHPPDELRDRMFQTATEYRASHAGKLDRQAVLDQVAAELSVSAQTIEQSLFADLKAEQRLISFQDITKEQLLHRYNVALAQSILIKATGVEVLIRHDTPQRMRTLFRAAKFHRLICEMETPGEGCYTLRLDGPLSLFSATQKYGMQLAFFLPHILQCRDFDLKARVRWGPQRTEKQFVLTAKDGLRSHLIDYGSYVPKELQLFAESFNKAKTGWQISEETAILPLGNSFWVPDFRLTNYLTQKVVHLDIIGFWRRMDVVKHHQKLREHAAGKFILAVSEQFQVEEEENGELPPEVYRFKRTPLPDEVAKRANEISISDD